MTFRFTGADVVVPPENMFLEMQKGVNCLAFSSAADGLAIFGNLMQRNMLVGYDLVNRKPLLDSSWLLLPQSESPFDVFSYYDEHLKVLQLE
ncbi:aspartic proteinase CDR1-like protein, partial [Tanacetum coccineum]